MSDFEPGTVAVATVRGEPNVRVVRVEYRTTPEWMTLGEHPTGAVWHSFADVTDVRPLVVIDPEDREQVERLTKALVEAMYEAGQHACAANGIHPDTTTNALRELANPTPPKPEVFEHLPLQQRGKTVESVCGKAWIPDPNVTVVGRCPECLNVAEGGWIA